MHGTAALLPVLWVQSRVKAMESLKEMQSTKVGL